MYAKMNTVAYLMMGLDQAPFPLEALTHPPDNKLDPDVADFMWKAHKVLCKDKSDAQAIKMLKLLKENPPKERYDNPKLPSRKCSKNEDNLIRHIFLHGLDLPGSKHCPFGHLQYFSNFFIDIFFGNYTEFIDHVNSLLSEELERALKRREGYCQFSPVFSPLIGLKLEEKESSPMLTRRDKAEIGRLYNGNNEHKHYQILEKLLELGADVNAHDIYGYTPLFYALHHVTDERMAVLLLKYGADPNHVNRRGERPLTLVHRCNNYEYKPFRNIVDILIEHNGRLNDKKHEHVLRSKVEQYGDKDFVARIRKAMPREEK